MRNRWLLTALVLSLLTGLSPLAADPVIRRGIDVFVTPANGTTFFDFAQNPIPAGFFCARSKVFTGRVALKGLPLATAAPGQLWNADTVVERLDDAAFDADGVATTRLQFRALSMVSIEPIKTTCGAFHAYVSLDGKQPVTSMKIQRTQEEGGTFAAPLAVQVRLTLVPVEPARNQSPRKLEHGVTFPAHPIPWSFRAGATTKGLGPVLVDTDGDLTPDTQLPGASNFWAGTSPDRATLNKWGGEECPGCCELTCHSAQGEEHCTCAGVGPLCSLPPIC